MSYTLSYTGAKIDSILSKADAFEDSGELWKVIPSSVSTLEIKDLMTPGNYIYSGSLKTPAMDPLFGFKLSGTQTAASKSCSCLIFVRHVNQNIYQYISLHGIIDSNDQTMCIVWIRNADYTYTPKVFYLSEDANSKLAIITNTSSDKGSNKFDKQIRVTTADKAIQYYDAASKSYKKFVLNMMQKSVYGSISNVFGTIDSKINYNFTSHGNDSGIHVTNDQIATYDAKQRSDTLATTISDYKTSLMNSVNSQVSTIKSKLTTATNTLSSETSTFNTHKSNTTLHPTSTKISAWDGKADTGHTHKQDGRVTVSASDVKGTLAISNIPVAAQERFKVVASTSAMLNLTSTDVQLGDWVWVSDSTYPLLFVVTDVSKLGTTSAFVQLTPPKPNYTWSNVQNKPTTMADLGITDAYTNAQIDSKNTTATNAVNEQAAILNSVISSMNECTDARIKNTSFLETNIDDIDQRLKLIMQIIEIKKATAASAAALDTVENVVS